MLEALLHRLEALARSRPVLMVFEDAHWIDPTSRELLDLTIDRISRLPVLFVVTFRPEFQQAWSGQPHVTMLALNRLGRRDGATLVERLAGNVGLARDTIDEIVERADGVPLFVEELAKAVLEIGDGTATLAASPPPTLAIPATLHASLTARLDRLGLTAKEIGQVGAVIGREFAYDLIERVAQRPGAELRNGLNRLAEAGLLFCRGTAPQSSYLFKHALVQDAAYGTLLRARRQELHGRVAAALEQHFADVVERQPELLAHHLAAAGRLDSAAAHWLEAGRRAAERCANIEAIAHLTRGIEALHRVADTAERARQELALQLALGPALMTTRGFDAAEAQTAYQNARQLAEQLSDDYARFAAVWGLWLVTGSSSGRASRRELAGELFRVAERLGDRGLLLEAHHAGWATDMSYAQYVSGSEHVLKGLELYDREEHRSHALIYGGHDPAVCGKGHRAIMLWLLGYPDQAAKEAREGIELAETLTHVPSRGHALWLAAWVHQLRRDAPAVLHFAERLFAICSEHGVGQYQPIGHIMHGWAFAHLVDIDEGLSELRRAPNIAGTQKTYFNATLAGTELRAGNFDLAMDALNDATAMCNALGETFWRAGLLCVEGDLVRARSADDWRAAQERYCEAIAIAREQQDQLFGNRLDIADQEIVVDLFEWRLVRERLIDQDRTLHDFLPPSQARG